MDAHSNILVNCFSGTNANAIRMEPIGIDNMLFTVERLMEAQAAFGASCRATHVDIGYHYTRNENLKHIKTNGLLTKAERHQRGVTNNYNGSAHGDGIYTSSNPFAFTSYGETGLLVARLIGATGNAIRGDKPLSVDTAISNRGRRLKW